MREEEGGGRRGRENRRKKGGRKERNEGRTDGRTDRWKEEALSQGPLCKIGTSRAGARSAVSALSFYSSKYHYLLYAVERSQHTVLWVLTNVSTLYVDSCH